MVLQEGESATAPKVESPSSVVQGDRNTPIEIEPVDPVSGFPPEAGDGDVMVLPQLNLSLGPGALEGQVFDESGAGIARAIVSLPELDHRTRTDEEGNYAIRGLPPGLQQVEFSKSGFKRQSVDVLILQEGPTTHNQRLDLRPIEVDETEYLQEDFDVVEEYVEESPVELILGEAVAPDLSLTGLGKAELSKIGVSDAAGAVKSLSGANIVGGRYAVVRGLGDRYSNTLVNGALISSADPSKKAIQLDLFPANLLQSVAIQKNFRPDVTAEWAGGLVMLQTLRFPEERVLEFKVGASHNTNLLESEDFYVSPLSDLGFWGDNEIGLLTNSFGRAWRQTPVGPEFKEAQEGLHLTHPLRPEVDNPKPGYNFEFTYGETFELTKGLEVGAVVSFGREQKDSIKPGRIANREFQASERLFNQSRQLDVYDRNVNWGFLGSLNVRVGEGHELGAAYYRFHDATDTVIQSRFEIDEFAAEPTFISSDPSRQGVDPFYGAASFAYPAFDALESVRRDLQFAQVFGSHKFGKDPERGPRMNWTFSNSMSEEIRPQTTKLNFFQLDFADPRIDGREWERTIVDFTQIPPVRVENGPEVYEPERGIQETFGDIGGEGIAETIPHLVRESLSTTEETRYGDVGFTLPIYFSENSDNRIEFSIGGSSLRKSRETRGERFGLFSNAPALNNPVFVRQDSGQFGIDTLVGINGTTLPEGGDLFTGDERRPFDHVFTLRTTVDRTTKRNINAETELDAFYLMSTLHYNDWTVTGGARYEGELRSYEILEPGVLNFLAPNEVQADEFENKHLAPAFSLTRVLGLDESHEVGVSWSRTVGRPTFFEFAPVFTEDQASGDLRAGNPDLSDSIITNYDLRWRWTPEEGTIMGINAFRKSVQNPIVKKFELSQTDLGREVQTYINADDGILQGVEFEFRHNLSDNFNFYGNYTYLDSTLELDLGNGVVDIGYEGQPEHIVNLILGYDNEDWGLSASLVYNYTGEFLLVVPRTAADDRVLQEGRHTLDLVVKKKLEMFGGEGELSLKLGNILDSPVREVLEPSGRTYDEFNPGRSVAVAFKVNY
tara:strand:- start:771 stop:3962 length:3192 start_codon:yes stop_codon:yes gene_type:complete